MCAGLIHLRKVGQSYFTHGAAIGRRGSLGGLDPEAGSFGAVRHLVKVTTESLKMWVNKGQRRKCPSDSDPWLLLSQRLTNVTVQWKLDVSHIPGQTSQNTHRGGTKFSQISSYLSIQPK